MTTDEGRRSGIPAEADGKDNGALVATLDLAQARQHRAGMGFFRDRRPELYARMPQDI